MSVVVAHPTGNPNVRSDLRALERAKCLAAFYTTIAVTPRLVQSRAWPASLRRELSRRSYPEVPPSKIVTSPLRELVRLGARAIRLDALTRPEVGWASWGSVYRALDRRLGGDLETGKVEACAVYAYEDAALETFRVARRLGLSTVYHLPIAYWRLLRVLLAEERERRPDWAATMVGLVDSPEKHERKDLELAEADVVVVASGFTRRSLACCPGPLGRIEVVPYGAPMPIRRLPHAGAGDSRRPLRALFVGHLSQRKGLADLDEAMRHVRGAVALTLIGPPVAPDCPALKRVMQTHRWIPPVPHLQVLELMADHDVLVFPSIVEGFGLVIPEALSRGLPVITTPHTGGPELLVDGRDGFIVPIRDPDAIADRLVRLAEDRTLLATMSQAALATARRNPWRRYEDHIVQILAGATSTTEKVDR